MTFPCWRYHRTESARIVRSLLELEQLGAGWFDSPKKAAAFVVEAPQVAEALAITVPVSFSEPKKGRKK